MINSFPSAEFYAFNFTDEYLLKYSCEDYLDYTQGRKILKIFRYFCYIILYYTIVEIYNNVDLFFLRIFYFTVFDKRNK